MRLQSVTTGKYLHHSIRKDLRGHYIERVTKSRGINTIFVLPKTTTGTDFDV